MDAKETSRSLGWLYYSKPNNRCYLDVADQITHFSLFHFDRFANEEGIDFILFNPRGMLNCNSSTPRFLGEWIFQGITIPHTSNKINVSFQFYQRSNHVPLGWVDAILLASLVRSSLVLKYLNLLASDLTLVCSPKVACFSHYHDHLFHT